MEWYQIGKHYKDDTGGFFQIFNIAKFCLEIHVPLGEH